MARFHKSVGHKHNGEHHSKIHDHFTSEHSNMPTDLKIEDWAGPVPGMPDTYEGSMEEIDTQIEKDNIKRSKIRPRGA